MRREATGVRLVITVEDPRAEDVQELLVQHLAFCRAHSPPEAVHALDAEGLIGPAVTLFGARHRPGGRLLGVGAIKHLAEHHGELKSMHTLATARGHGVGRAVLVHLLAAAMDRGYRRLSLETGAEAAFAPARSLYRSLGFVPCAPFADYVDHPHSRFMTISLAPDLLRSFLPQEDDRQ